MAEHDTSFSSLADALVEKEETITQQLIDCQGDAVDMGGYYSPDPAKVEAAMRPSSEFNALIDN